ncbi:MAG: DUF3795 domain-containing protein [Desulfobacteraceae bacterium]|nr:MAG: DUF3795 domain-containing protein [Desulfobacteraceae bacterium]
MKEMISYCGLVCNECPAYIATRNDDDQLRAKVAEQWSRQFGFDLKADDVNCDGCRSGSERLIGHCRVCAIRKCGMAHQVKNCAHCDDYGCNTLESFIKFLPHAKSKLEQIREGDSPV